jgi:hypothetical protein
MKSTLVDGNFHSQIKPNSYKVYENGDVYSFLTNQYLEGGVNHAGYNMVKFSSISGGSVQVRLHRLVAFYFVPNHNDKPQVNHIDGDKNNNHANNLEWVTAQENTDHAFENNLRNRIMVDEEKENQIRYICELFSKGENGVNILTKLNKERNDKNRTYVNRIYNRHRYKNISKDYNFPDQLNPYKKVFLEDVIEIRELLKENTIVETSRIKENVPYYTIQKINSDSRVKKL